MKEHLTVREVAEMLGVGEAFVYKRTGPRAVNLAQGEAIPAHRLGRSVRIPRDGLEEWLRRRGAGSRIPREERCDQVEAPLRGPKMQTDATVKQRKGHQRGSVFIENGQWKGRYRRREFRGGAPVTAQKKPTLGPAVGPKRISKAKARTRLAAIVGAVNEGRTTAEETMTLREWANGGWARSKKGLRAVTLDAYRVWLNNHILPAFGDLALGEITPKAVQDFLDSYGERGYSRQSLQHMKNLLSGLLRQPHAWGWIRTNPARLVALPEGKPRQARPALSLEQCWRLLGALEGAAHCIVAAALMTGLRRSEMAAVRIAPEGWQLDPRAKKPATGPSFVDWNNHCLVVNEACVGGVFSEPKTKSSMRVVPLDHETLTLMNIHADRVGPWVFGTSRGTPFRGDNFNKRILRKACERAKLPIVTLHELRHTHATLMAPLLPEYLLKLQLGHAGSGVTFGVYVKDNLDRRRAAVGQLSGLLFPCCALGGPKGVEGTERLDRTDVLEQAVIQ